MFFGGARKKTYCIVWYMATFTIILFYTPGPTIRKKEWLENTYSDARQYRTSRDQQISSVIGGFLLLPI